MTSDEKISEHQVWSSQQYLQLLHSSFSHLRKFYQTLVTNSWISYRLSETMSHTCEIWTTFYSNFLKWKNSLYKDCWSWWAEQTWYWKVLNTKFVQLINIYNPYIGYFSFEKVVEQKILHFLYFYRFNKNFMSILVKNREKNETLTLQ